MKWLARIFGTTNGNGKQSSSKTSSATRSTPRHSKSKRKAPVAATNTATHRFRAVRIYSNQLRTCSAAEAIADNIYLAGDAPNLPLPDCSHSHKCTCRYRHLSDRRQEPRRDADHGLPGQRFTDTERRSGTDRRRL